jgi:hypothetical protein
MNSYKVRFRLPSLADLERCRLVSALVGRPVHATNPLLAISDSERASLRMDFIALIPDQDCDGLRWFHRQDADFFNSPDPDVWPGILIERVGQVIDHWTLDNLRESMRIALNDGGGDNAFAKVSFLSWFDHKLQGEVDEWRWAIRHEAERRFPRYSPLD